ncbi:ParB/RepB/Spo0J family partition protein [Thermodesulfobacteriota bacterium]
MESNHRKPIEIELNALDLRYAHTRVSNRRTQDSMTRSIERYGQLNPVVVVARHERPVLVDGYLRVGSLETLGRDTVIADVSEIDECRALLQVLSATRRRQWKAVEQAWIIREIKERFDAPLRQIARDIGHDVSWVSRRLALIDDLPEDLLGAVLGGHVSAWAAGRVLAPLARANKEHAEKLIENPADNPLSTRQLSEFFEHYQRSGKRERNRMIADPGLFVKAKEQTKAAKQAKNLRHGPEGAWIEDPGIVKNVLRRVLKRLPTVIYEGQDDQERRSLVRALEDAVALMDEIKHEIAKAGGS